MCLDDLIEIYEKWGEANNIKPLLSADELLMENTCTKEQNIFLIDFIKAWEMAEDIEKFIYNSTWGIEVRSKDPYLTHDYKKS